MWKRHAGVALMALLVAATTTVQASAEQPVALYETTVPGYYLSSGRGAIHDDSGNVYVLGGFVGDQGQSHAIILKLHQSGELAWTTTIEGADHDYAADLDLDPGGDLLVAGWTDSPDFPQTQGPIGTVNFRDAFVVKLSSSDGSIIFSTKIGGDYTDEGHGIRVCDNGDICIMGQTGSTDFPTTPDAYQSEPSAPLYIYTDVFVTRLNAQADSVIYSTYFGGFEDEYPAGFDLAPDGSYVFSGSTTSDDFPLVNEVLSSPNGLYVSKLSADGSTVDFSTYYGGGDHDGMGGLDVGSDGAIYITGSTRSPSLLTTPGSFEPAFVGAINGCEEGFPPHPVNCSDAFVAKMYPDARGLDYATYLGGTNTDRGLDIAVDETGSAYVAGYSASTDFPGSSATSSFMFVSRLTPAGDDLVYTHAVESGSANAGNGISVGGPQEVYFTGAINVPADVYVSRIAEIPSSGVDDQEAASGLRLAQNSPNPFSPQTAIAFVLPERAPVFMTIHDAAGRLVRTLIDGEERTEGEHLVTWDGRSDDGSELATGVYFCRVTADEFEGQRKMLLLK